MTTNDIFLRALRCEQTPRRPLWIMRQAGRYLPEYRALRARHAFLDLATDPDLAAEVTLQPIERFGFDAAIVFADLMSPIAALGVPFRFDPGPVLDEPLRTRAQIRALPAAPDPREIAPEVPETLRRVKRALDGRAALIGFGGAPLSLAAYLVEGRGSKAMFPRLRALAFEDPVAFEELMERLATLVAGYLVEQHRAGADAVQIFESWAGVLPRAQWRELVRPHLAALLGELGRAGVPRILFCHGAPELVGDYAELESEALAVCWRSDLAAVRAMIGPERALQGNLDPAVLLAGPETTRRETERLLASVPARGHVVNLGHGIMPEAPIESVEALVAAVRAEERAP